MGLSPRGSETEPEQKTVSLEACKSLSPAKYKYSIHYPQGRRLSTHSFWNGPGAPQAARGWLWCLLRADYGPVSVLTAGRLRCLLFPGRLPESDLELYTGLGFIPVR